MMRKHERRRCRDIMSRSVVTIGAEDSIQVAASLMRDNDIGALPVTQDNEVLGIITDRDIVIRAVAQGLDLKTKVAEVMSKPVIVVQEDEFVFGAIKTMGENQVRRLPVVDSAGNLVGMISMADIALESEDELEVAEMLEEISSGKSFWRKN
jgi:CBS domain-containing protein